MSRLSSSESCAIAEQAAHQVTHKYGGGDGPKEGDKSSSKSGKPIIFQGGKWIYARN